MPVSFFSCLIAINMNMLLVSLKSTFNCFSLLILTGNALKINLVNTFNQEGIKKKPRGKGFLQELILITEGF